MSPSPEQPRDAERPHYGMVHGRFQPFHNAHLEYARLALDRCELLIVGITNPDPTQIAEEETSAHRHRDEANPFTYFERQLMIRGALTDDGVPVERVIYIPFPINLPERWRYYVPDDAVHYLRVFSPWEQAKVERLREHGYRVEVLQPGAAKTVEATEVRRRLDAGEDWEALVPPGVARVIRGIRARPRVTA